MTAKDITHEFLPDQNPDRCIKGIWSIETDPGQFYPTPSESAPHEMCVPSEGFCVCIFFTLVWSLPRILYRGEVSGRAGDNITGHFLTPISNMSQPSLLYQPLTNDLYTYGWTETYSGQYVYRMRDFPQHLTYDSHYHTYSYNGSSEALENNGTKMQLYGFNTSSNGRWLVGATADSLLRYDLQSDKVVKIGMKQYFSNNMWPNPSTVPFCL